ncbi:MFS transporter [Candidatus Similichlamydia laticola]|uniref:Hexose phosphate uptake regulatory protein UhpC n=1 Tax=Candidatus Similichlamydia laticola TaxID=2170265 RepID=A0A369KK43_9BACT|nr:MFS transporter [Candidatus Similichlamydia laticola]RDB31366.1 Hexose phosphate uptake regulatory protein UhpC [Candidatus Similichlamydia laticola]
MSKTVLSESNAVIVSEENRASYHAWRMRVFCALYFGYILFSFTRRCFAFAAPLIREDLQFSASDLGLVSTVWAICYGIGKFVGGIISDRSNPRYFMACGLFLTGACNLFFGFSSKLFWHIPFWGLNGWFQGTGWPSCARCLTNWFSFKERGRWWGLLSTSHNIAGVLVPVLYTAIGSSMGWRSIFFLPSGIACLASIWLMDRLRESPSSAGLPSLEELYPEECSKGIEKEHGVLRSLFRFVFARPIIWLLGFAYFFLYSIRTGLHDWLTFFFIDQKGYDYFSAGSCVLWFELGGVVGSVLSGWVSDFFFLGRRMPVNLLFMFLFLLSLGLFFWGGATGYFLNSLQLFISGALLFGPQMLIGLTAAEVSHKTVPGSTHGFVSLFAQFGSAFAGYPFGLILSKGDWSSFAWALIGCSLFCTGCMVPVLCVELRGKKSI